MAARRKDRDPDPIAFLVEDHERLQKLFRGFEAAEVNAVRRALAERACAELKIHAALEAEIFYPAARAALGTKGGSIVNRAEAEHAAAARLIAALEDPASDDTSYAADFARLAARVRRHIDREEREIFARFRQRSQDRGSIAARLRRRKEALLRSEDVPGQIEPSADAEGEYEPVQREMQKALVATALRFGDALRRFETRRRRRGYDYSCSRLLDEVRLSRSLLLVLADEVGRGGIRTAASPH